jgi:hypothetical protein
MLNNNNEKGIYIVDVGDNLIGISGSTNFSYTAYYGNDRISALEILENAKEIVTFNGKRYDYKQLCHFSEKLRSSPFNFRGVHTDIMPSCWQFAFAANLINCFKKIVGEEVSFPDTHEGSNQSDVYMTLKLWEFINKNKL